jgi:hypothetical protein
MSLVRDDSMLLTEIIKMSFNQITRKTLLVFHFEKRSNFHNDKLNYVKGSDAEIRMLSAKFIIALHLLYIKKVSRTYLSLGYLQK